MREVHQFLGVPGHEIAVAADVPGVGPDGGVAGPDRVGERRVGNAPAETAVADALQLAIPTASGSQTSTRMSESDEGVSLAVTRQKAGTS